MQNISSPANPAEIQKQECPSCYTKIPVYKGFVTWCDNCNWNVNPYVAAKPKNIFEAFYENLGSKLSNSLYKEIASREAPRPTLTKGKISAYLVAGVVHGFTLALLLLGLFLLIGCWPAIPVMLIGLGLVLLAWYSRPRFPRDRWRGKLDRQKYPTLYEMAGKVCDALNTSRVENIYLNEDFNVGVTQVGWRRKKILIIGLPLFSILSDEERLAVLGHEIGHCINGDPNRTLFIGTAINSLVTWYPLLLPARSRFYNPGLLVLLTRPILNVILRGVTWCVKMLIQILSNLNWRETQRAEYLADSMAAKVGGSEAAQTMLGCSANSIIEIRLNWWCNRSRSTRINRTCSRNITAT
ncbi:MAG: M48 family metallopeptidase [Chloroflexi bacterium]|nr:M48 family metallopeptidase [Chloroflexota bacterium]OJV91206.1 MAG: hypothetical protein BGO39_26500 [Chloroflexi bacterium 54-19]